MEWKDKFPKKVKPSFDQLLGFFNENVRELFLVFDKTMNDKFKVYNKWQRFETTGWVYGYCRNYRCELLCVTVKQNCFNVLGVKVDCLESLHKALKAAEDAYNAGYEKRYAETAKEKCEKQIKQTKIREEREKAEMSEIVKNIDSSKLNKFKWSKKVSRQSLLKLYKNDARRITDEETLEDVGGAFYIRCKQALETRKLLEKGKLICHGCGKTLSVTGYTAIVTCSCGHSYTYREYRRSCNAVSMPGGRATPIFDQYIKRWENCKEPNEKMMLIDWLIHQCHVSIMSGLKGRSVCVNLIEGTQKQIAELIVKLAYQSNE